MIVSKYSNFSSCNQKDFLVKRLIEELELVSASIDILERTFPIYFNSSKKSPICINKNQSLCLNLMQLLDTLFHLACDPNNEELFRGYEFPISIKKIVLYGNNYEAEYAVRILFQMTFSKDFQINDPVILNILKKIIIYSYPNKNLIRYCEGILWMCEKDDQIEKFKQIQFTRSIKSRIIISFDSESYDLCMMIEKELKKSGFLVWFKDVKDCSLEEDFLAILSSDLFLLG
jgi:hypothetical protein